LGRRRNARKKQGSFRNEPVLYREKGRNFDGNLLEKKEAAAAKDGEKDTMTATKEHPDKGGKKE